MKRLNFCEIKNYIPSFIKYKKVLVSIIIVILAVFIPFCYFYMFRVVGILIGFISGLTVAAFYYQNIIKKRKIKQYNSKHKKEVLGILKYKISNVDEICDLILKYAPQWVFHHDIDHCHWINICIKVCWPNISYYVKTVLHKTICEIMDKKLSEIIGKTSVKKLLFGNKPPTLDGIRVVTDTTEGRELVLDCHISYCGDAVIELEINCLPIGIKEIYFRAGIRIIIPLNQLNVPFTNRIDISLLTEPTIEYNLTGLLNVLEFPIINTKLNDAIFKTIRKMCVFPKKVSFPINFHKKGKFNSKRIRIVILQFEQSPQLDRKLYGSVSYINKSCDVNLQNPTLSNCSNEIVFLLNTSLILETVASIELFENEAYKIDRKVVNSMICLRNLFNKNLTSQKFQTVNYHDKNYGNTDLDVNLKLKWLEFSDESNVQLFNCPYQEYYFSVLTLRFYSITDVFLPEVKQKSPQISLKIEYGDESIEINDLTLAANVIQVYSVSDFLINHSNKIHQFIRITLFDKNSNICLGVNELTVFDDDDEFVQQKTHQIILYSNEFKESYLHLSVFHYQTVEVIENIKQTEIPIIQQNIEPIPAKTFSFPKGVSVQHDKSILGNPNALVYIDVIEAKNLTAKDNLTIASSDPYVILQVQDNSFKTSVKSQTLFPVWNESFSIILNNYSQLDVVDLNVWDHDNYTSDDKIGSLNIPVQKELDIKTVFPKWYPLSNKGGEIKLGFRYISLQPTDDWKYIPNVCVCLYFHNVHLYNKKKFKALYYFMIEILESDSLLTQDRGNFDNVNVSKTKVQSSSNSTLIFDQWCHLVGKPKNFSHIQISLLSAKKQKIKASVKLNLNSPLISDSLKTTKHFQDNDSQTLVSASSMNISNVDNILSCKKSKLNIDVISVHSKQSSQSSVGFEDKFITKIVKVLKYENKPLAELSMSVCFCSATH